MVLGSKLTAAPVGVLDTERLIELLNPPVTVVVLVAFPWFPCEMLRWLGDPVTLKLEVPII